MPHIFTAWEDELEPQPAGSRRGGLPPGKRIGIDVLDPQRPPAPNRAIPDARSRLREVIAFVLLAVLGALVLAGLVSLLR